ncbi:MAG: AI-2E family transporter [Bacteroidota bacterium]
MKVLLPFYLKVSQILLGLIAFFFILYIGREIIVPLIFSTILAIVLNPVVNFLNRKINRVVAISITITLSMILLAALFYFIGSQLAMFSDSFPLLKQKFTQLFSDFVHWISDTFNISTYKVKAWIEKTKQEQMKGGGAVIGQTLISVTGTLVVVLLVPIYMFMILFYKPLLLDFIGQCFSSGKRDTVADVLMQTKTLIQSYLTGLLLEALLVATLNSVGLLIIGVDYAILLGIIGAILNLIPYIGGIIAIALPMIMAITTQSGGAALAVLGLYIVVQLLDNNFFVPMIVASKVKVNALVSIVVVLIGGALWGVGGMFLSIPLTAIVKVICDRVPSLKPMGFLLGDTMPQIGDRILNFRKYYK